MYYSDNNSYDPSEILEISKRLLITLFANHIIETMAAF